MAGLNKDTPTPQDITDFQVKLDAALRQAGY